MPLRICPRHSVVLYDAFLMPQRIRIIHTTEYHYLEPVSFGPHRAMIRPREGHDLHITRLILDVSPAAGVRWLRDIHGNSVAMLAFSGQAPLLRVHSEAEVDLYADEMPDCPIETSASEYPFQYAPEEQIEIVGFRLPSYPHDSGALLAWLHEIHPPGVVVPTRGLLDTLNTRIHSSLRYVHRDDPGVQLPCETLAKGTGSCRDYAVLMMEAARHWGFAARFVTGYVRMEEGQHGSTHAWTEVYLPGAGWQGFDPTNNKPAGSEHVAVGVAREQEKAAPLSGTWTGPDGAFDRMNVVVRVEAL